VKVELLRAWPRRFDRIEVELPDGASVADALARAGWAGDDEAVAYAVFGVTVTPQTTLLDGDRIELLRPLQADPKDARRRRAEARRGGKG
jgi:putative ubiquitin-RnfH superfamily antitoxin RatB of RatAB toxin-antitoxin module